MKDKNGILEELRNLDAPIKYNLQARIIQLLEQIDLNTRK